jgi:ABC-2 type transport system ATP-binding protein
MSTVIEVNNLQKSYGTVIAVDNVSFQVQQGEIFGMVGPNGAGKTTTIECLEGVRNADYGSIKLLGLNPLVEHQNLSERIGIQLQASSLPPRIRVEEALDLFASFYQQQANPIDLLNLMDLTEKRDSSFAKLSGGQKQRLFIALALINRPEIVFFDELTTGLDPQARRSMWDVVRNIRDNGCTVFLTTHFMEEAERLCDRVLIIDHGKIVALDKPETLIRSLGIEKRLVFTLPPGQKTIDLSSISQVQKVEQSAERLTVSGQGETFASSVVNALEMLGVHFLDLRTEQPTLEDVFLSLTGREIKE